MTLLLLLSISLVLFSFSTKPTTLTQAQCSLSNPLLLLQSWNASTDCCTWDAVKCDQLTGEVSTLDLTNRLISGKLNPALFNLSSLKYLSLAYNQFDGSVLPQTGFERLGNLAHLNLSNSGYAGQVPLSMSLLTNLKSLDLSDEGLYLHGTGLKTLLHNLTKLQVLRMDWVNISSNGSEWGKAISQLGPTLQELSMTGCSLTGPIDPSLSQLKQLKVLQLDKNELYSPVPIFLSNFSSLSVLTLWDCRLRGEFPYPIFHNTNLTLLDLSQNEMLSGQLPEFSKEGLLQYLFLSGTNFTGPIPDSIGNLQYLSTLDLSESNFHGKIPANSIANLTRLTYLELEENIFTGTIPTSLYSHPTLESLSLSNNQFSGNLSEFQNGSWTLKHVYLSYNNLQGQLPISIFKLPQLSDLHLNSNNFSGNLNLDIIKHNENLESLDLSHNKLSITESVNLNASLTHIQALGLASCNLTKFPSFLSYQRHIEYLDLSNNKIDGVMPSWLWSKKALSFLNLSHNLFTEMESNAPFITSDTIFMDLSFNYFSMLPSHFYFSRFNYLSLSNNRLTGDIPLSICNATSIDLYVLDLSHNNLTGMVPPCLLKGGNYLQVLNLKSNKLSGTLPRDFSPDCGLETINLNGNRINGSLPKSLMRCTYMRFLDLGNNQIASRFPYWLGNLENLRVLILKSNQFYGKISNMETKTKLNGSFFPMLQFLDISSNRFSGTLPAQFFENLKAMMTNSNTNSLRISDFIWSEHSLGTTTTVGYDNSVIVTFRGQDINMGNALGIFTSLDLSKNEFSGEIPEEIGQLKWLLLLNLSHNNLMGPVPSQFGNLEQLESLDLSSNQLSGHIPQELTYLTFLSSLNLSYNNLNGEIPQTHQFSTFSNDSYLGNSGLCGNPLSMQCVAPPSNHGFEVLPSKSSNDFIGLSISIGLGFGVGFATVVWALVCWENGSKWFNFNIDRFYFRHMYQWKFVRALYK